MFVRTMQPLSADAVRELAWEMAESFGAQHFWIFNPTKTGRDYERRALTIIAEYEQDGDTIYPQNGEQFIEVALGTRYYGYDYERGDLPLIIAVAMWLELRIVGASIWYGGDSSGVCAEPFGAKERTALFEHFAIHGHRPYTGDPRVNDGRRDFMDSRDMTQPVCAFCQQPMHRYGFGGVGGGYGAFRCLGCDLKTETRDGGVTWTDPDGGDATIAELERQLNWHKKQV